jgi:methionyl-tRNA formyltransferase
MSEDPRPRVVFMGTPELARVILRAVVGDPRLQVILVVAQPDRPAGRGLAMQEPPTKSEARSLGIPVAQPERARDPDFIDAVRMLAPELILVAAYGQILPQRLLDIPARGCLNVHTSLLPRWRGAAPISWAILEGDPVTGVTLMRMNAGLDTGDVLAREATPISAHDTAGTLHDRLATLGASLLLRTLPLWLAGRLEAVPQETEGVTYARKLTRSDAILDWQEPAIQLGRRVRAMNPSPGAFTTFVSEGAAVFLKVWEAEPAELKGQPGVVLAAEGDQLVVATGDGSLRLKSIQRQGRRRLAAREFLASGLLKPGDALGTDLRGPTPASTK